MESLTEPATLQALAGDAGLLTLVAQNSGQQEFVIDADAVRTPDKVLSERVVAIYRALLPSCCWGRAGVEEEQTWLHTCPACF